MGVDQTDPSAAQASSAVKIDFNFIFDIVGPSGTFGPTINPVFTIPFGAKIGPNGTAQFACHIEWEKKIGGITSAARVPYDIFDSVNYSNGTNGTGGKFFNGSGSIINVLQSFTVDAVPFNVSSIGIGNQLIVKGVVQFASNNDEGPVTSLTPRDPFDAEPDPMNPDMDQFSTFEANNQQTKEYQVLQLVPEIGFEVVPEPACGALVAISALMLPRGGAPELPWNFPGYLFT